ncbi:MAG: phage terminase small subunit [Pseudomonadota bacterium]
MTSLARRRRETILAAQLAASPAASIAAPTGPAATQYEQLREQLGEDMRSLSQIQSVERKIEAKRAMVGRYQAWVEGAMRAGRDGAAAQDEIVTTMLVWNIDIGNWIMALQLAVHVLTHNLPLPERYKRTPATLIAEEIADRALADAGAVDHGTLIATEQVTERHDMPDQVRAKLLKALGRNLMLQADTFDADASEATAGGKPALITAAMDALRRAKTLDEKVGVTKDIEKLERELKKLASTS